MTDCTWGPEAPAPWGWEPWHEPNPGSGYPLSVGRCGHLLRRDALCSHRRCSLLSREWQQWVSDYVARSTAGGTQNG